MFEDSVSCGMAVQVATQCSPVGVDGLVEGLAPLLLWATETLADAEVSPEPPMIAPVQVVPLRLKLVGTGLPLANDPLNPKLVPPPVAMVAL